MNQEHHWPLFRLCLAGLCKRGSCWLLLVGLFLFVWIAPLLTPWDEHPQILQPARAQATWIYLWLALLTWFPFQCATLGKRLRTEGFLEFLRARGQSLFHLQIEIGAAVAVWVLVLVVAAMAICLTFCLPKNPADAALWAKLVVQYAALYLVVALPLVLLSVGLGTRAGEVVAYLIPVALLFLGGIASMWLAPLLAGSDAMVYRVAWVALPHYHLADLTPRLVFKMGPLSASAFFDSSLCLILQGATLTLLGRCAFQTKA